MKMIQIARNLKYHIVDSTALLTPSSPFFCAFETMGAGMSDDVSLNTRFYIAGLTYSGLGWLVSKGRDFSRKMFNITGAASEKIQQMHDSLYLAATNIPLSIGLYTAAGETDIKKIAAGTAFSIAFGLFMGPMVGYSIDAYRDLTGLESCERRTYPHCVRQLPSRTKKALAAGLVAAAIGTMGLIYWATPNRHEISARTEQVSYLNSFDADKYMEYFVRG